MPSRSIQSYQIYFYVWCRAYYVPLFIFPPVQHFIQTLWNWRRIVRNNGALLFWFIKYIWAVFLQGIVEGWSIYRCTMVQCVWTMQCHGGSALLWEGMGLESLCWSTQYQHQLWTWSVATLSWSVATLFMEWDLHLHWWRTVLSGPWSHRRVANGDGVHLEVNLRSLGIFSFPACVSNFLLRQC